MKCKALVTGVEVVTYKDKTTGEQKSFSKVNFIDTESPAGSPQSMSLSKDAAELAKEVNLFEAARLKVLTFNVFQNGNYTNFGGVVPA